jgi:peptidoglycan/xylan/chitin deacetylase (PgdA/CDA1 family)
LSATIRWAISLVAAALAVCAEPRREVAITVDDVPLQGAPCDSVSVRDVNAKLLAALRAEKAPVTGFVIGRQCKERRPEVLKLWRAAGAELGNHTWSHPDLNGTPLAEYEADIVRNEDALPGKPRYFRHPMLHAGGDAATKRALDGFLAERGYRVAPVTLDNSDWIFARAYSLARRRGDQAAMTRIREAYLPYMESIFAFFERRSVEVTGREIRQVLLLHVSELNAGAAPALLRMIRARGYRFVTLDRALADPAYRLPEDYAGPRGFSWLHRWALAKGMETTPEPAEPEFVRKAIE